MNFPSLFGALRYHTKRIDEICQNYTKLFLHLGTRSICSLSSVNTAKDSELSQWRRLVGLDFGSAESADGPSSFLPNHSQASPFNITFQYRHSAFSVLLLYLSSPTLRRHGPSRATTRMPRRKAADPPSHKRRSRNGCVNCRRRKIRCDEGSPSCSYCRARSLTCSRGGVVLKWEADYADNGLAFGRQGVGPAARVHRADAALVYMC
jgi:hypothetical protein